MSSSALTRSSRRKSSAFSRAKNLLRRCFRADFAWTTKPEDRKKLWQARHDAAYANKTLAPGKQLWATDVCVPISRLAECISETKKDIAASFMLAIPKGPP